MSRKRVTYRPSKTGSAIAGVVGLLFVGIGLFVVIPVFGAFGIVWTLVAAVIAGANLYQAFGKGYIGPEIHIEEEGEDNDGPASSVKDRLEELENLRASGLITELEYEQKRQDILRDL